MSDLSTILWVSVVMQCLAVWLALRLIPITGHAHAWIILSVAFLLMATRRSLSLLYEQGIIEGGFLRAFSTEIVALVISLLIVIGVFMIREVFIRQRDDAEKVRTLSLAVEQNPCVTIIIDINGCTEYVNSSYCLLTGNKLEDVIGELPKILNPELISKDILGDIWGRIKTGRAWEGEIENRYRGSDDLHWDKVSISPVKNDDDVVTHYVILQEDVTEQKENHEQLKHLVLHDALTDLPNRTYFNDRLKRAIITAKRNDQPLAVMLMDLNNFKEINDTMGHQVGDDILREISARLLKVVRGGDTVARMGGDEFLLLLPAAEHVERTRFIQRITSVLETPFIVGDRSFEIRASIGLSLYPDDGEDYEILLKNADIAMYSAKKSVDVCKRYDKSLDEDFSSRLEMANSLRTAVDEDQFVLHYQPLVNIGADRVDKVEALIRWNHPEKGLLNPDSFIPLAEQTHHIYAITQWVIKNVFRDMSLWKKRGIDVGVSLNISARDLLNSELYGFIENERKINQLTASQVTIEITESALMMHTYQTMKNLQKLSDMGFSITIDDFGTGYSSLQHLKRFPVSGLKIDKSFVMNMIDNENDAIIVRSTVDLAHNMGLAVVAEGIENEDIYSIIEILGCDYGQGYHIAKPMDSESFQKWIGEREEISKLTLVSTRRR
ncbi:MAG: EAL domain-containing protein [Gammaproteobacteria bacterium]|nr:EAL domain-containing protein [Gammaproteobacteria bacterium]